MNKGNYKAAAIFSGMRVIFVFSDLDIHDYRLRISGTHRTKINI